MTQPPVRFENYPPDETSASAPAEEQRPTVRPYVPATIPPPSGGGTSRRTVLGLMIGIPVAGILLSALASFRGTDGTPEADLPGFPDPNDDDYDGENGDSGNGDGEISVGRYSASVPPGWTMKGDASVAEVFSGANRLVAVSLETATASLAVEEIARLTKPRRGGFTGKIADPVDRSSAQLQHATMDGAGKYEGRKARLLGELWVDSTGSGLLVVWILTAKPNAPISAEAQGMTNELSADF